MKTRERFQAVMAFRPVDRLPMIESYWWWKLTLERWHQEGLPRRLTEHGEIARYLGLDVHRIFWISPRFRLDVPNRPPRNEGFVRNDADYERWVRPSYAKRAHDPAILERYAEEQERGAVFVWLQLDGFFWLPRILLGVERHLLAFYDQPELMHRMNADLAEYNLRVLDEVCRICTPDVVSFAEDLSYNSGSMISPRHLETFLAPYYRRILPAFRRRGILSIVDTDGDATDLAPWLEKVGIEGATPLERHAGTDIARIREGHPRFRLFGHFDKTVMPHGEAALRREFERLLPVMRTGGYLPSVDHQTPPDVSLADYRLYVSLFREYAKEAAHGGAAIPKKGPSP